MRKTVCELTSIQLQSWSLLNDRITNAESTNSLSESLHGPVLCYSEESQQAKPVRPKEFRLFAVLPFVLLQIALAIALGILLRQSQPFGTYMLKSLHMATNDEQALFDHLTAR